MPAGPQKKELLENLDQIPTYVQSLQFIVKNPTVGKAATFTKVDNVIQETKNLMNVISKVVTTCFDCATKVGSLSFSHRSGLSVNENSIDVTSSGNFNNGSCYSRNMSSLFQSLLTSSISQAVWSFS